MIASSNSRSRRLFALAMMATLGAALLTQTGRAQTVQYQASVRAAPKNPVASSQVKARLPFTFPELASYFSWALEMSPMQIGNTAYFYGPVLGREGTHFRLGITEDEQGLLIAASGDDDYAVTIIREFFDSSFFWQEEKLILYSMLDEAKKSPLVHFQRFTASCRFVEHGDTYDLSLRFSPPVLSSVPQR